ncbi:hypothetical protein JCM17960_30300 [Magnetospira thiophila]
MDTDDLEPKRPVVGAPDLAGMSIEALGDYIAQLETEIERARAAIEGKQAARAGAESVFKF